MKLQRALITLSALAGVMFMASCAVPAKVDPAAQTVLEQCTEKLRNASTLQAWGYLDTDPALLPKGMKSRHMDFQLAVSRPDNFGVRGVDHEGMHHLLAGNGGITIYNERENVYATNKTDAKDMDGLMADVEDQLDMKMTIGEMLGEDPMGTLMDGVTEVKMGGVENVNGVPCTRLDFTQKDLYWQMWIAKSDSLPRRSVLVYIDHAGKPKRVATINKWKLDAPVPASMFNLSLKKGAHPVGVIH